MAQTDRHLGLSGGIALKAPCIVASTANITTSSTQVIDGISVSSGDRVLLKDQTTVSENGIWDVGSGSWTRAVDFNGSNDAVWGTMVSVTTGSANGGRIFGVTSTGNNIPGTDSITWAENTTLSVSTAITVTTFAETLLDDSSAVNMRTTLGLVIGDTSTSGNVQQYDAQLADLAGITPSTGGMLYFDTSSTMKVLAKGSSGQFLQQGADLPQWAGLANTDFPSGTLIAFSATQTSVATTSTVIVPNNFSSTFASTDGTEMMTLAHTAQNTANTLVIDVGYSYGATAITTLGAGFYIDSCATSIAAFTQFVPNAGGTTYTMSRKYKMLSGSTVAQTFKFRAGLFAGNLTMNGLESTAGEGLFSHMSISEYSA